MLFLIGVKLKNSSIWTRTRNLAEGSLTLIGLHFNNWSRDQTDNTIIPIRGLP